MWQCPYEGMSLPVHNITARLLSLLDAHTNPCVKTNTRLTGAAYWTSELIKDRTPVVYFQTGVQRAEVLVSCCLKGRNSLERGWGGSRALRDKDKDAAPPTAALSCVPSKQSSFIYSSRLQHGWILLRTSKGLGMRWEKKKPARDKDLCLSAKTWDIEQAALPRVTISDRWSFKKSV